MRTEIALAGCLVATPAMAGPRSVSLAVDPCVEVDRGELGALFAQELAAAIPGASVDDAARVELRLDCDAGRLRIAWRDGDRAIGRRIDPGPATGRERTIALAAVELAVAGWLEPTPARAVEAAAPPVIARPRESPWTTTVSAGALVLGGDMRAQGASVRVARARGAWGWAIEAGAATGRDEVALGAIDLDAATAAASVRVRSGDVIDVHLGGGGRASLARFRGDAMPGALDGEVRGVAAGPVADAGATACNGGLCVEAGVEAGYHVAKVRAEIDGDAGRALDGAWWGARAGVGWRW